MARIEEESSTNGHAVESPLAVSRIPAAPATSHVDSGRLPRPGWPLHQYRMNSSVPVIPGIKAHHELAQQFQQEVAELLRRRNTSFPGAQPVSFARHHLDELEKKE